MERGKLTGVKKLEEDSHSEREAAFTKSKGPRRVQGGDKKLRGRGEGESGGKARSTGEEEGSKTKTGGGG